MLEELGETVQEPEEPVVKYNRKAHHNLKGQQGGRKGRSGPPGNLNAARYPWRSFWRRKAVSKDTRWILPVLEGYASGLASDKPGLTEAEARVVEIAQIARGATMLILAECAKSGFTRPDGDTWDLTPGAKELAKFLSVERSALQTLGLERRARPIDDLASRVIALHKGTGT